MAYLHPYPHWYMVPPPKQFMGQMSNTHQHYRQFSAVEKIEDCIEISEPTIMYPIEVKDEIVEDWSEVNVKEDLSAYEEASLKREWIDCSELSVILYKIKESSQSNTNEPKTEKDKTETVHTTLDKENKSNKHMTVKHGSQEGKKDSKKAKKQYQCQHCSYVTDWSSNLAKHLNCRHIALEEVQWVECTHCSYRGKSKEYLRRHQQYVHKMHTPTDKPMYNCSHCPFTTKTRVELNNHTIINHTAEDKIRWFECDQCSYRGKLRYYLKMHKMNNHTKAEEVQWHQCKYCYFHTKYKKSLKSHMTYSCLYRP